MKDSILSNLENENIASLLKDHEESVLSSIPFNTKQSVTTPSTLFKQYAQSGNTVFKDAAGAALNKLQDIGKTIYNNPVGKAVESVFGKPDYSPVVSISKNNGQLSAKINESNPILSIGTTEGGMKLFHGTEGLVKGKLRPLSYFTDDLDYAKRMAGEKGQVHEVQVPNDVKFYEAPDPGHANNNWFTPEEIKDLQAQGYKGYVEQVMNPEFGINDKVEPYIPAYILFDEQKSKLHKGLSTLGTIFGGAAITAGIAPSLFSSTVTAVNQPAEKTKDGIFKEPITYKNLEPDKKQTILDQFAKGIAHAETSIVKGDKYSYVHHNDDGTADYGMYGINDGFFDSPGLMKRYAGEIITRAELLASPALQDKIVRNFAHYWLSKGETADEVARMWTAGASSDPKKSSRPQYVKNFSSIFNSGRIARD